MGSYLLAELADLLTQLAAKEQQAVEDKRDEKERKFIMTKDGLEFEAED